jgi:hypothetical protein
MYSISGTFHHPRLLQSLEMAKVFDEDINSLATPISFKVLFQQFFNCGELGQERQILSASLISFVSADL